MKNAFTIMAKEKESTGVTAPKVGRKNGHAENMAQIENKLT